MDSEKTIQRKCIKRDDIKYYRHLSTARLVDELNWHFIDTFTDEVMMNVEDMRTFYLNKCGAIVSVLYERQPKEDLKHIRQLEQELESAFI